MGHFDVDLLLGHQGQDGGGTTHWNPTREREKLGVSRGRPYVHRNPGLQAGRERGPRRTWDRPPEWLRQTDVHREQRVRHGGVRDHPLPGTVGHDVGHQTTVPVVVLLPGVGPCLVRWWVLRHVPLDTPSPLYPNPRLKGPELPSLTPLSPESSPYGSRTLFLYLWICGPRTRSSPDLGPEDPDSLLLPSLGPFCCPSRPDPRPFFSGPRT